MREIELGRLAPGHFFGEGGLLTGSSEPGTIRALTFVVVYEITQEGLAPLLRDRPAIAEELGSLLARHAETASHSLDHSGDVASVKPVSLAVRIRHFFKI